MVIIDLCALLLAPPAHAFMLLHQLAQDGHETACWADLPKQHVRHALQERTLLQFFDRLFYSKVIHQLETDELLQLAAPETLWIRFPEECNYDWALLRLGRTSRRISPYILAKSCTQQ